MEASAIGGDCFFFPLIVVDIFCGRYAQKRRLDCCDLFCALLVSKCCDLLLCRFVGMICTKRIIPDCCDFFCVFSSIGQVNLPAAQLQVSMGLPLHMIPDIRKMYGREPHGKDVIDFDNGERKGGDGVLCGGEWGR